MKTNGQSKKGFGELKKGLPIKTTFIPCLLYSNILYKQQYTHVIKITWDRYMAVHYIRISNKKQPCNNATYRPTSCINEYYKYRTEHTITYDIHFCSICLFSIHLIHDFHSYFFV